MDVQHPQPPPSSVKIRRTTSSDGSGSGSIILGKYQLGRLLGRGSFAKVYLGRCLDDNTEVAVKVINKTTTTIDASMEPRIIREVSAMRRLNHHPNILKLHEVMATKTKIYFVMELCSRRRAFHEIPIAVAGFLNPPPDGHLKISDFGLSALPEQLGERSPHRLWYAGVYCSGARRIINRLLDLNPDTRYGIEELMNTPWFKKSSSMKQEQSTKQFGEGILEKESKHMERMNAFDIISMSSGLDLSSYLEVDRIRRR
ncbi:CBL-interacting serine/threonine-protein kinase 4 [Datura stramonium]|uniref:non-specific serine/threonine protein kinase n=1 Tax=Datura stramonium TaxID=4076 RepID=A0ABS8VD01_DATST|nr:CBL-interacting serine/threonine-protein kinase 4 [Datura stramonium]